MLCVFEIDLIAGVIMSSISYSVHPKTQMRVLSHHEIAQLQDAKSHTHKLLRQCAYAVLSSGNHGDSYLDLAKDFKDFDIQVKKQDRGIVLTLINPPPSAFVGTELMVGVREQLFSVLRDILYVEESVIKAYRFDLLKSQDITNAVFHILRNANILHPDQDPNLVICWGGHSIARHEYDYSKKVGYHIGLHGLNVGTGCGPGAMKGPMKGATIGHAKQHIRDGRYIGITEPSIIASEAPNAIVNELVILPDIEKRLEAFVRLAHGIVIFPGGPGTAEEIIYLLGILMDNKNKDIELPLIITGPKESEDYLMDIHEFIGHTLGEAAQSRYQLIIDSPKAVASAMHQGMQRVKKQRCETDDAFFFNWSLHVDPVFQMPFEPTHENMASLNLSKNQPKHELAGNLRSAFSGIVAGNVKQSGVERIAKYGPYQLQGDADIMQRLGGLLNSMVEHGRMRISGEYKPCYEIKN